MHGAPVLVVGQAPRLPWQDGWAARANRVLTLHFQTRSIILKLAAASSSKAPKLLLGREIKDSRACPVAVFFVS